MALGMFGCRLSTKNCLDVFKKFATTLFTGHLGSRIPGLGILAEIIHHCRYPTAEVEKVFKEAFGECPIFGDVHHLDMPKSLKVGVTATSSAGCPNFIANYNRHQEPSSPERKAPRYTFLRADDKEKEIKIWEA